MIFRYRYVDYGTSFKAATGNRPVEGANDAPAALHKNELALDVGSICWGFDGEQLPVLDHHFHRDGQFPSASAAVLHKAPLIQRKFSSNSDDVVWLVTHQQPDFDAFCSMYLARSLIEGNIPSDWLAYGLDPEGWKTVQDPGIPHRRVNWFSLDMQGVPSERRWPLLLASYASHVDNGRHTFCPKHRALHAILYAALYRGRDDLDPATGAIQFFDEARQAIESRGLNPLFDSVMEDNPRFAPELRLLDQEVQAYQRDLQRARKAIVHLQKTSGSLRDVYDRLCGTPLIQSEAGNARSDGPLTSSPSVTARSEHLDSPNQNRSQADGIYIRDPECLLFKEWARTDTESSSLHAGFTFTAVAYSGKRSNAGFNTSNYYFAIDPERADGRHLYTLWARLETAEVNALLQQHELRAALEASEQRANNTSDRTRCRYNFEDRAGTYKALFDDPWFDGSNYDCTIVATPNRGTFIGKPGTRSDLIDDRVVEIVRRELEGAIYPSANGFEPAKITIQDLSASPNHQDQDRREYSIFDVSAVAAPDEGYFRFGSILLNDDVDPRTGSMAEQIGEMLWQALNAEAGVPTDFSSRHLLIGADWVGVWSRRGIVIAVRSSAAHRAKAIETGFRNLVTLVRGVEELVQKTSPGTTEPVPVETLVRDGEKLTVTAADITRVLATADNRLLSRLFDALEMAELLRTLRDFNSAAAEKERRAKLALQTAELTRHTETVAAVQIKVEWLEIFIVGFYATELAQIVAENLGRKEGSPLTLWLILAAGFVAMAVALLLLKPWAHRIDKQEK